MIRRSGIVLLLLLVGLSHMPRARAEGNPGGTYAVYPRVVATVIVLAPRGLATIRTSDGATSEVVTGTAWWLGDTVACEHTARGRTAWHATSPSVAVAEARAPWRLCSVYGRALGCRSWWGRRNGSPATRALRDSRVVALRIVTIVPILLWGRRRAG